eukprot:g49756.t1
MLCKALGIYAAVALYRAQQQSRLVKLAYLFRFLFVFLIYISHLIFWVLFVTSFFHTATVRTCDQAAKWAVCLYVVGISMLFALLYIRLECSGLRHMADKQGDFIERHLPEIMLVVQLCVVSTGLACLMEYFSIGSFFVVLDGVTICVLDKPIWSSILFAVSDLSVSVLFAFLFVYQVRKVARRRDPLSSGKYDHYMKMLQTDMKATFLVVSCTCVVVFGLAIAPLTGKDMIAFYMLYCVIGLCSLIIALCSFLFTRPFQVVEPASDTTGDRSSSSCNSEAELVVHAVGKQPAVLKRNTPDLAAAHSITEKVASPSGKDGQDEETLPRGDERKEISQQRNRSEQEPAKLHQTRQEEKQAEEAKQAEATQDGRFWWRVKIQVFGLTRVTEASENRSTPASQRTEARKKSKLNPSQAFQRPHEEDSMVKIGSVVQEERNSADTSQRISADETKMVETKKENASSANRVIPPNIEEEDLKLILTNSAEKLTAVNQNQSNDKAGANKAKVMCNQSNDKAGANKVEKLVIFRATSWNALKGWDERMQSKLRKGTSKRRKKRRGRSRSEGNESGEATPADSYLGYQHPEPERGQLIRAESCPILKPIYQSVGRSPNTTTADFAGPPHRPGRSRSLELARPDRSRSRDTSRKVLLAEDSVVLKQSAGKKTRVLKDDDLRIDMNDLSTTRSLMRNSQ